MLILVLLPSVSAPRVLKFVEVVRTVVSAPDVVEDVAALAEVDRTAAAADAKGATVLGAAPSGSGLNME